VKFPAKDPPPLYLTGGADDQEIYGQRSFDSFAGRRPERTYRARRPGREDAVIVRPRLR